MWRHILAAGAVVASLVLASSAVPQSEVSFADSFSAAETVYEAPAPVASLSPEWWVNSGARMTVANGVATTVLGKLPPEDVWRQLYSLTNPVDTDGGKRPQNVFRLLTRRTWRSFKQTVHFRVLATNMSESPNRNESNAVLLFLRYLGGNDFYYAGVRVDGAAVIKRKRYGVYTTLAHAPVFPGSYDRERSPNLLPPDRWLGLKAAIVDRDDGSVKIKLKLRDPALGGGWIPILDATDVGQSGEPIRADGVAGIRTDFMDVAFDDYAAVPKPG